MILVLGLGVLMIVGSVVVGAFGIATPARAHGARKSSLLHGAGPSVALVGGALLVVMLAVGVVLAAGLGGGQEDPASTAATPVTSARTTTVTRTIVGRTTVTPAVDPRQPIDREVDMHVGAPSAYASPPTIVDGLAAQSVLRIAATGFEPNTKGFVEQCSVAGCADSFPVLFDDNGAARLQYLVSDAFASALDPSSTCRAGEPPCVVHLRSNEDSAFLTTVFHDVASTARLVSVEPSAGLVAGGRVRVAVTGFIPGEVVQAMVCAAPDTYGSTRCGAPGPISPFTIDADGTGTTTLVIRHGRVGSDGAVCGRGAICSIVVSPPVSSVPAPAVLVTFATGPAARYDRSRFAIGLAVALALLTVAFFLARTTDWRKPTDAETPDLDRAVLVE